MSLRPECHYSDLRNLHKRANISFSSSKLLHKINRKQTQKQCEKIQTSSYTSFYRLSSIVATFSEYQIVNIQRINTIWENNKTTGTAANNKSCVTVYPCSSLFGTSHCTQNQWTNTTFEWRTRKDENVTALKHKCLHSQIFTLYKCAAHKI